MAGRKFAHDQERPVVREALKKNHGNIVETAKVLDIPYSTLNYKIRVLGLKEEAANMRAEAVLQGIRVTGRKPAKDNDKKPVKKKPPVVEISPQAQGLMDLASEPDDPMDEDDSMADPD